MVSPQAGHFLVSPQAVRGTWADCSFLSAAGAFLQPKVPQPPISCQHSAWWIWSHPGQVWIPSPTAMAVWQMGQMASRPASRVAEVKTADGTAGAEGEGAAGKA